VLQTPVVAAEHDADLAGEGRTLGQYRGRGPGHTIVPGRVPEATGDAVGGDRVLKADGQGPRAIEPGRKRVGARGADRHDAAHAVGVRRCGECQHAAERRAADADARVSESDEGACRRDNVIDRAGIEGTVRGAVAAQVDRESCEPGRAARRGEVGVVLLAAVEPVDDHDTRRARGGGPIRGCQARAVGTREGRRSGHRGHEHSRASGTVRGVLMTAETQLLPSTASVTAAGHLAIGGCDLVALADEFGTPLVVYDEEHLRATARAFIGAYAALSIPAEVVYASKAYFGLAVLRVLRDEGLSVDVASGGELHAALAAGFPPERIYLHGNNKTPTEVDEALRARVGTVIIDGFDEIALVESAAARHGIVQRVMIRVTPGVDPATHAAIATGQVDSKFGFPLAGDAQRGVAAIRQSAHLELVGLHAHLGSQLFDLSVFGPTAEVLADFAAEVGAHDISSVDLGGGLGVAYTSGHAPPSVADFAAAQADALRAAWGARNLPIPRLLCEPGRSVVGRAGVTLYRVGGIKDIPGIRTYASVDGGMSDLLRPMLYGAVYEPVVAGRPQAAADHTYRIVGKHCESGDILVADARLPQLAVGDVICLPATGAYGVSMASNYNGQPRPAVVFAAGGRARVVTRRETYADILGRDRV
jgi:diaminopimelate decarboxylase